MTVQRYVGIFTAANLGQNLAHEILAGISRDANENIRQIIFIYSIKFILSAYDLKISQISQISHISKHANP